MEKEMSKSFDKNEPEKPELKRVQLIAKSYYARKDIQQAIFDFCKNREVVPRYLEGFGKRPDALDYPSDIFNYAKKGATSFHCSEELWNNPLEISRDFSQEQLNQIKSGWDFLIDIDSKYLDYSKIAAKLIVKTLEYHGVKNIGIKFSGSKGFHLIVPWKAFPKELNGELVKNKFPEYARLIAQYLQDLIHDELTQIILSESNLTDLEKQGKEMFEITYKPTGEKANVKQLAKYFCPNCKAQMQNMSGSKRKILKCPSCSYDMQKTGETEVYIANSNNDNSQKHPELFEKKPTSKSLIESVDIVLVSSRHLFRVPYSLHEKTALSSIVIEKNEIENFRPQDADPLKVQIKSFNPENIEFEEARELLIQAIDWQNKNSKFKEKPKKFTGKSINVKNLQITEEMFPNCIKKLLLGIKGDGKKRALFILLSFFRSLEFPKEYIEEKIEDWNKKNQPQLKQGYIQSQVDWSERNKIMPPNCGSHYYKDLQIQCTCKGVKNPINYTIKQALRAKGKNQINQNSTQ